METCNGVEIQLTILVLYTGWKIVVIFTPLSIYPQGKRSRHPLDRSLGEHHYQESKLSRSALYTD
jgi:hypothetical protein